MTFKRSGFLFLVVMSDPLTFQSVTTLVLQVAHNLDLNFNSDSKTISKTRPNFEV